MTPYDLRAIIHNMVGKDVNPYPITLLVNYWEIPHSEFGIRLDRLLKEGITEFASFVPWQVAESDINHSLPRFLQAVSERNMKVSLILTPELGIQCMNSGLPRDIVSKPGVLASHFRSGDILAHLPPHAFYLPSFFASDVTKRYYGFLSRMDSFFTDLSKILPKLDEVITPVITGSYWKYFRSPSVASQVPFGGAAGDYSSHAALAFRQSLEQFYSQKEFSASSFSGSTRWKTRSLEEFNRRWFYQQSEDVFLNRSQQMIRKKATRMRPQSWEVFTPEADPSMTYSSFLQNMAGGHVDFSRLSKLLDEYAMRRSFSSARNSSPMIHWTTLGGFHLLSEPEKQFLILKSILLFGSQNGSVCMEESDWFSLSSGFRRRCESVARFLSQGDLRLRTRAYYLVPHLWSSYGTLWEECSQRVGPETKMVTSVDGILKDLSANLLIIDPSCLVSKDLVQKIVGWTRAGRVAVVPKTPFYSDFAKAELAQLLEQTQKIQVELGITYSLHALGDGKLVVYDAPDYLSHTGEPLSAWQSFLNSILSLSEVHSYCRLSDSRLSYIPLERKSGELAFFVLNSSHRSVDADLLFPNSVEIQDLGGVFSGEKDGFKQKGGQSVSSRFNLEVPPFGILPLGIETLKNQEKVLKAAQSQLPGFKLGQNLEDIWN